MPIVLALLAALLAPSAPQEAAFESNGVTIRYASAGSGEAVVLVHGWMGDSTIWGRDPAGNTRLEPAEGFRALALDCRGHGKSGKPHDPAKYGAEMAEDVVRLLDHLDIRRAHLVGYSMGAFIVGHVVANHPERAISATYGGQAPLLKGEAGSREVDALAKAVEEGNGLGPYLMEVRPALTRPQADALAKVMYNGKDAKAWALAGQGFKGLEVKKEDLLRAGVPSLFIYGSKENEATLRRVAALRKDMKRVEEKVLEGSDHVTALRHPEFGATIVAFLKRHPAPSPSSTK